MVFWAISILLLLIGCYSAEATKSEVVRTVPVNYPALYPEKFVWDEHLQTFIAGSLATGALFSISDTGSVTEFIRDEHSGISAIGGLAIDDQRRRILAVVYSSLWQKSSSGFKGIAAYDLDTKARLFLAPFDQKTSPNDIAIDGSGHAYVTDSANNVILKVTPSGNASLVFAESPIFTSQPIVADEPAVAVCGLNGIAIYDESHHSSGRFQYLLVVQSNSGKLFRVGLHDAEVRLVDMDVPLVGGDGISVRKDGLIVVVSSDAIWLIKSRNHWKSAYLVDQLDLDRTLNTTTVALRGSKDDVFVIHSHLQDLITVAEKGIGALPGGEFRSDFSFLEIKLPGDPDNHPFWLVMIVVAIFLVFGGYKLQMNMMLKKYNRRLKRD